MNQESWRSSLYYLLGFLPSLFFGLRFFVQWLKSEKAKRSHVTSLFWYLSFCGNVLCFLHYFIQLQYLLMLIQVGNAFISWRNIALLRKGNRVGLKKPLFWLSALLCAVSALFFLQFILLTTPFRLVKGEEVFLLWHYIGGIGCLLFASRFWVQWLLAERAGVSHLSTSFWWLSICGSLVALVYFVHIRDWVSSLNYSFGLLPYIRNIMLLRREGIEV